MRKLLESGSFSVHVREEDSPLGSVNRYFLVASSSLSKNLPGWSVSKRGVPYFSFVARPLPEFFRQVHIALPKEVREDWLACFRQIAEVPRILYEESGGVIRVLSNRDDLYVQEVLHGLGGKRSGGVWNFQRISQKRRELLCCVFSSLARKRKFQIRYNEEDVYRDLLPHQKEGLRFLSARASEGRLGALLAHDMGTGKTVSGLAFFDMARRQDQARYCIAVGPLSAIDRWREEWVARFGSDEDVYQIGSGKKVAIPESPKLILVHYNALVARKSKNASRSENEAEKLLPLIPFLAESVLVLDEVTYCKNEKSVFHHAIRHLSAGSKFVVSCTGTPIENHIGELHSIIRITDPTYYPRSEFRTNHIRVEEKEIFNRSYFQKTGRKLKIEKVSYVNERLFSERVADCFHRVVKENLDITLPDMTENWVDLAVAGTPEGQMLKAVEAEMRKDIDYQRLYEELGGRSPMAGSLLILQQAMLNSPRTVLNSSAESEEAEICRTVAARYRDVTPVKMKKTLEILDNGKEDKTLIFSSFERTHRELEKFLSENLDARIFFISGSIPKSKRTAISDAFKEAEGKAILLCTDSMTYGGNFGIADRVIHYDLPWTRSKLDQRTDRIHRCGFTSAKEVYYLVLDHPVEKLRKRYIMEKGGVADRILEDDCVLDSDGRM